MRGYLPLCQGSKGEWKPLSGRLRASVDEAVQVCVDRIRADVEGLEDESLGKVRASLERITTALARLSDRPGPDDRLVIHGQECVLEADGSVRLPPWRPQEGSGISLEGDGGRRGAVVVDEAIVDVVRRALREQDMSRERVSRLIPDLFESQAFDLLLAVAETAPDRLADVAALVVAMGQARGQRSLWHPERGRRVAGEVRQLFGPGGRGGHGGPRNGAPRNGSPRNGVPRNGVPRNGAAGGGVFVGRGAGDGVVEAVIDDEAPAGGSGQYGVGDDAGGENASEAGSGGAGAGLGSGSGRGEGEDGGRNEGQ